MNLESNTSRFCRPTVVLTGAPGSGKTTALNAIAKSVKGAVVLDEAATVVKRHNRISGDDLQNHAALRAFQRAVLIHQLASEELLGLRLYRPDARVGVLDRAILDGAAYLPGGRDELQEIAKTSLGVLTRRYSCVLWFSPAPRDIYEAVMADEAARGERFESYEEAVRLGEVVHGLWSRHENFIEIDGDDWPSKFQSAVNHIARIASLPLTPS